MHTHLFKNSVVLDEKPASAFNSDETREWSRKLERRHGQLCEINTVKECVVDSFGDVLVGSAGEQIKRKLWKVLIDPYISCIFEGTMGSVVGDDFLIHAKFDPNKTDRSPKAAPQGYDKNLFESVLKGIEEKLDDEAAKSVLTVIEL